MKIPDESMMVIIHHNNLEFSLVHLQVKVEI